MLISVHPPPSFLYKERKKGANAFEERHQSGWGMWHWGLQEEGEKVLMQTFQILPTICQVLLWCLVEVGKEMEHVGKMPRQGTLVYKIFPSSPCFLIPG